MKGQISIMLSLIGIFALGLLTLEFWGEPIPPLDGNNGSLPISIIPIINLSEIKLSEPIICPELEEAFKDRGGYYDDDFDISDYLTVVPLMATGVQSESVAQKSVAESSVSYSTTNIQVEGVDEADIIKTDGKYIYLIANRKFIIAQAYPVEKAKILSTTNLENFYPNELFIDGNKVLLFGSSSQVYGSRYNEYARKSYPMSFSSTTLKLYDVANKQKPLLQKSVDFEGNYLTSRKIGNMVYFVVNSYPRYDGSIIPVYRAEEDFKPVASCGEILYVPPMATNFLTIASFELDTQKLQKQVIAASGQNVYASLENIYVAETSYENWDDQDTIIHKFSLSNGRIDYKGNSKVPGRILNQFSMDEHDGYFRIATTEGHLSQSRAETTSTNNLYVLNKKLEIVGELEDLAPGESIYSVRFMGKRAYVVTFKKVDPLFVIDLSKPTKPSVLGKLKIPGYSDYLHPYDENHIIGVGKDTVEAEEGDFAWYQGIKMALFDVSDVENPKELHKVIIGDRGTDSPALSDHKAFLFDREKNLLALPVTVAEVKDKSVPNQYGEYLFQGAHIYDLTLENGFVLRGRVTHYDNDEAFRKSGYYFAGDASIQRLLFIEDVLYSLSNKRLQLNSLEDLETLRVMKLPEGEQRLPIYIE